MFSFAITLSIESSQDKHQFLIGYYFMMNVKENQQIRVPKTSILSIDIEDMCCLLFDSDNRHLWEHRKKTTLNMSHLRINSKVFPKATRGDDEKTFVEIYKRRKFLSLVVLSSIFSNLKRETCFIIFSCVFVLL